jgi:hypothetical protein
VLTSPVPHCEAEFNTLWVHNADAISVLYSGTGALKTDFTKTGKRTPQGIMNDGYNSLLRFILNNFVDGRTQDAWDLFLGKYIPHNDNKSRDVTLQHLTTYPPLVCINIFQQIYQHFSFQVLICFYLILIHIIVTITILYMNADQSASFFSRYFTASTIATIILSILVFLIVKKGWWSKFGQKMVSRPSFLPLKAYSENKESKMSKKV